MSLIPLLGKVDGTDKHRHGEFSLRYWRRIPPQFRYNGAANKNRKLVEISRMFR
jgi:hypothetical protein